MLINPFNTYNFKEFIHKQNKMSQSVQVPDIPAENVKENDGVTWWCKILVKVIGVVAAIS